MHFIFPSQFYSLISPPNKEDILSALKSAKVDKEKTKSLLWNKNLINVKVELLYPDDLFKFLIPSLQLYFKEFGVNEVPVRLVEIWKNTYTKGGYQEVHDHLGPSGIVDIAGCIFLDDYHPEYAKFFFHNRHSCEISPAWRRLFDRNKTSFNNYIPTYKKGDIMFFPANMPHGVYPHKSRKTRQTVSFNIGMN